MRFTKQRYCAKDLPFQPLVCVLFLAVCLLGSSLPAQPQPQPRYVFLFIGDGMGMSQRYAAELYLDKVNREDSMAGFQPLAMSKLPERGECTTFSCSEDITDSAASGTAFACGLKTHNGRLSVDPDAGTTLTSVAERAHAAGYRVGIVSSVSIDHATPAVFYAHNISRNNYYEIGKALTRSGFDYFAGGGFRHIQGPEGKQPSLLEMARTAGYTVVHEPQTLEQRQPGSGKTLALAANPAPGSALPYQIDSREAEKTFNLEQLTRKGIELLDNPKGFFMMVESGKIDWACHAHDAGASIHETLVLDRAVQAAIEFAEKHPDDTLIIVTADHETGGMTIGRDGTGYKLPLQLLAHQKGSRQALEIALRDYQQRENIEANFQGALEILHNYYGLHAPDVDGVAELILTDEEIEGLRQAWLRAVNPQAADSAYGSGSGFGEIATDLLNSRVGIGWTTGGHTGTPVPLMAEGPGAERFSGLLDNTDIAHRIAVLMGLNPDPQAPR